jgi:putative acetyltransferase
VNTKLNDQTAELSAAAFSHTDCAQDAVTALRMPAYPAAASAFRLKMEIQIRCFEEGDELALRQVFYSGIHQISQADYTAEQLAAWAPALYDEQAWRARMRGINPFIAEVDGRIVGYADLQPDGYIDHFFVAGSAGGIGVGGALMRHIYAVAEARGIAELRAHVSLTAQPFFKYFRFELLEHRMPVVRGIALSNALMRSFVAPARGPL